MDTLLNLTENFLKLDNKIDSSDFSCLAGTIRNFLKSGSKEDAFSTYFAFSEIFKFENESENSIDKLVNFLAEHEFHSGELLSKHRDHYSHSVYVFCLGLAYYANTPKFRQIYSSYYGLKNQEDANNHFLHYWGFVSLFHDIGYPFQLAHEQIYNYTKKLWPESDDNPYVRYNSVDKLLDLNDFTKQSLSSEFSHVLNMDELFSVALHEIFGFDTHMIDRLLLGRHDNREFLDHGYYSALLLGNKFQNTSQPFTKDIIDVLVAILIHNSLIPHDLKDIARKAGTFKQQVSAETHPLSYLILLMDEIQCWDREPFGFTSKKDPLAWKTEFEISDSVFKAEYVFDSENVLHYQEEAVREENTEGEFGSKFKYKKEYVPNNRYLDLTISKDGLSKFDNDILNKIVPLSEMKFTARIEPKDKIIKKYASDNKLFNLVAFAKAIHKNYQNFYGGNDFDDCSLEQKLSNIEQAKSYAYKLELINCFYSDKELDYQVVEQFIESDENDTYSGFRSDLSFLAREEHIRWVKEKLDNGWKYGVEGKDYTRENRYKVKRHKDLVPYDFLTTEEKDKDELMIANMIPLLYSQGNGIKIYSYRSGRKNVLDIGAFGHVNFKNNEQEFRKEVREYLKGFMKDYTVIFRSTFRPGSELIMAEEAIKLGITIKAAIPFDSVEKYVEHLKVESSELGYKFGTDEEFRLRHLLAQCVTVKTFPNETFTYLSARTYILEKCDKLLCLYDKRILPLFDIEGNPIHKGTVYDIINTAVMTNKLSKDDLKLIICERKGKQEEQ